MYPMQYFCSQMLSVDSCQEWAYDLTSHWVKWSRVQVISPTNSGSTLPCDVWMSHHRRYARRQTVSGWGGGIELAQLAMIWEWLCDRHPAWTCSLLMFFDSPQLLPCVTFCQACCSILKTVNIHVYQMGRCVATGKLQNVSH